MPVTRFHVWVITFGLCCALFFAAPSLRTPILAAALLYVAVFIWGIVNIRSQFFGKVLYRGDEASGKLSLTFDDGPDPNLTPAILDTLARHQAHATFFTVGKRAEAFPDIVKRAFNEGHVIACHDLTHAYTSNFRMTAAIIRDVSAAQSIIERIIGKKPLLYRPPVGLMNPHVPIALSRLGMTCIGWSRSGRDAGNRRLKALYRIPLLAKPGGLFYSTIACPNRSTNKRTLSSWKNCCNQ